MKLVTASIILSLLLILGAMFLSGGQKVEPAANNVSIVDGVQIVEIGARGGYSPRITVAKAGIPTIIRVSTNGTYDCSLAFVIPSMGIRKNLPMTGSEDFDIGTKTAGEVLKGTCSMGMYGFEIKFQLSS
jgi:Cu+-exporting ATPase